MATGVGVGVQHGQGELATPDDAVLSARSPRCHDPTEDAAVVRPRLLGDAGRGDVFMAPTGPQLLPAHRGVSGDPFPAASATTASTKAARATPRSGRFEPRALTPTVAEVASSS